MMGRRHREQNTREHREETSADWRERASHRSAQLKVGINDERVGVPGETIA